MTDDLLRHIYEEYFRLHPADRQRSQWVMDQATLDHLESTVRPPSDDEDDDDRPRAERPRLLGRPIEIREGIEGIQIEVTPWPLGPEAWDPDMDSEG